VPSRAALVLVILCCAAALTARPLRHGPPARGVLPGAAAPGRLEVLRDGRPAGLCPLRHTAVAADIAADAARVTVTQEFGNPASDPIEAVYTFPLPEDAAVDDMTMRIGSRVIQGEIRRREEARAVYEAAKAAGQAAALLDQERPNVFTQSVANILPGQRITVAISYVAPIRQEEGVSTFVFPMVVGPRFVAGNQRPGTLPPDHDPGTAPVTTDRGRIAPPVAPWGMRAGHDISIRVRLDAGMPIQSLDTPLHQVVVRRPDPTRALVRLQNRNEIPNRDFVLRWTCAGAVLQEGLLVHAPRGGEGWFTLVLQPPAAPPAEQVSPRELVFVIDQTGSQQGWPIARAKDTMRLCLRALRPGDTFQLLAFNTRVYPCFERAVPPTPDNLRKALEFLEPLEGNGGTDILQALDHALRMPDDPDRLRIVCYMTDGYVGNDMQILAHIAKNRGRARIFPFGIGNSVNRFLIEGMAREGRGAAEYVAVDTAGSGAVMGTQGKAPASPRALEAAARFQRRIDSPLLVDPQIDFGGLPVADVYPRHLPDVFTSAPIVVRGRYTHPGSGTVTIRGLVRGRPWSRTVPVTLPAVHKEGSAIATLWARAHIEDLQSQDWMGAQTGSPKPHIKEQIVRTALAHRLMTQHTSFVAVEQRVVNIAGTTRRVEVPGEMPHGVSHDGIFGREEGPPQQLPGLGRGGLIQLGVLSNAFVAAQAAKTPSRTPGAGGGAGGLGGGALAGQAAPQAAGQPGANAPVRGKAGLPLRAVRESLADATGQQRGAVVPGVWALARGRTDRLAAAAALKPEERAALLLRHKLDPRVRQAAEAAHKSRAPSRRLVVQVWINSLPNDGMRGLKAAGFEPAADLIPGRLILGRVRADRVRALLELPFVRLVEKPRLG